VIVLGFDTATSATAVGLRLPDGPTFEDRDEPRAGEHPGHATRLLGMAAGLLEQAGISWRELDRIGVGLGPGTFTGLRVGVATARGLAQSLGLELAGVSSLGALAHVAQANQQDEAGTLAVIDARRGEIFIAAYGPGAQELLAPRALAPQLLAQTLAPLGPRSWLAIGDGAIRYREALSGAGVTVPADASPLHLISGGAICALAAAQVQPAELEQVLPDYRRRPDAELSLAGASGPAGSGG
jgi:tRNA threonylcarbamoyladenosine biosynthesis protein TsaB